MCVVRSAPSLGVTPAIKEPRGQRPFFYHTDQSLGTRCSGHPFLPPQPTRRPHLSCGCALALFLNIMN